MGKIWIEVCLISARGLRRTSSLFKLQWYAVGWIDSNDKYCTRIDASGNANSVWKTKFSTSVDDSGTSLENLALNVEVYSREPIFLRERLQGTATIVLKEFLDKFVKRSEGYKAVEEVGSFQLRKRNSNKPRGFIDVSIRVSEEKEDHNIYSGDNGGIKLIDYNKGNNLSTNQYGAPRLTQPQFPPPQIHQPENHPLATNYAYASTYSNPSNSGPSYSSTGGPPYPPPQAPPPLPPPSNVGYIPTFPSTSYMSMPHGGAGGGGGAGFGMGLGAGALAAGAVIFSNDFMSGFSVPSGLQNPSLTIATDSPF